MMYFLYAHRILMLCAKKKALTMLPCAVRIQTLHQLTTYAYLLVHAGISQVDQEVLELIIIL